jgi:hypothetical protein
MALGSVLEKSNPRAARGVPHSMATAYHWRMPLAPYKNEKHMSPRRTVWHYTSLDAVVAMIKTGSLQLTRMDHFEDKFEGSTTNANMEELLSLAAGAGARSSMYQQLAPHFPGMEVPRYRDLFTAMTERREAAIRATHANCWSSGEESDALWKLFCRPIPNGVALRSTFGRLRRSVALDDTVRVCPVRLSALPHRQGLR